MLLKLACVKLLLERGGLFFLIYYGTVLRFPPEFFADFLAERDGTEIHGRY